MKSLFKFLAISFAILSLASCKEEEQSTYYYSISNRMELGANMARVMKYAEENMKMGQASLMSFEGSQESADESAKAEFANRLKAIDETKFCSLMTSGEYYEFVLYRAGDSENSEVEIASKKYSGK